MNIADAEVTKAPPSNSRPVRWGILGTSRIAANYMIPALSGSCWCDLRAVGSRSAAVAEAYARQHGIPAHYGSYADVLDDPDVEAVYIPLPNHMHVEYALEALGKGKHVLCEKPVAMYAADASRLADAATGLVFAEALMVRHHPQWTSVSELIRSGAIGTVTSVQVSMSFTVENPDDYRLAPEMGGGAIYDLAGYCIFAARTLFEREPVRVSALMDIDPVRSVDRSAGGIFDFGGGCHATFAVGNKLGASQSVRALGTEGSILMSEPFLPLTGKGSVVLQTGSYFEPQISVIETVMANQYQRQIDAFSRAVRGIAPLAHGIEDAIRQMRAIDAVFAAGRSGRWVNV